MLEKVHSWVTKIVPKVREMIYGKKLAAIELPTLEERRKRGDMITASKSLYRFDEVNLGHFFEIRNSNLMKDPNGKLTKKL